MALAINTAKKACCLSFVYTQRGREVFTLPGSLQTEMRCVEDRDKRFTVRMFLVEETQ